MGLFQAAFYVALAVQAGAVPNTSVGVAAHANVTGILTAGLIPVIEKYQNINSHVLLDSGIKHSLRSWTPETRRIDRLVRVYAKYAGVVATADALERNITHLHIHRSSADESRSPSGIGEGNIPCNRTNIRTGRLKSRTDLRARDGGEGYEGSLFRLHFVQLSTCSFGENIAAIGLPFHSSGEIAGSMDQFRGLGAAGVPVRVIT